MSAISAPKPRRRPAVGGNRTFAVIRQSHNRDESVSPANQRKRLLEYAERDNLEIRQIVEELDVSGKRPLSKRPGLSLGVELVEAGEIDVLAVAFFDRLVRNLGVQQEILDRVSKAGGRVMTVDFGQVSHDTAASWLSATSLGMVAEYTIRQTAERTADAKYDAVMRGVAPFPQLPVGLRASEDPERWHQVEHDPATVEIAREAFAMRAGGANARQVRDWLRTQGVGRSLASVRAMLRNRLYLGELRYGDTVNEHAFPPVVDAATFRRAQSDHPSRGRYAKVELLLARQGVLLCSGCGGRMVVMTSSARRKIPDRVDYSRYRCSNGSTGDCPAPTVINAPAADKAVLAATRRLLRGLLGSASMVEEIEEADRTAETAQALLDAAVDAFDGIASSRAKQRLLELQAAVDEAESHRDRLAAAAGPMLTVPIAGELDSLSLDEQRRFIKLTIASAVVGPAVGGDAGDRITVVPRTSLAQ